MIKNVIIVSGGMDSVTLLYDIAAKKTTIGDVAALSFQYGQKHRRECDFAKYHCNFLGISHKVIDISFFKDIAPSALTSDIPIPEGEYNSDDMKKTVVPNRNMVMLSIAAAYAIGIGATNVYYGAHAGDHVIYPDCRDNFVDVMKSAFGVCDWNELSLHAPYLHKTKAEIVEIGISLNVDYSKTLTCYNGAIPACGRCGSCDERKKAFAFVGVKDPLVYEE